MMKIRTEKRAKTVQRAERILIVDFRGKTFEVITLDPMNVFGLMMFCIFCFCWPGWMMIFIGICIIAYSVGNLYADLTEKEMCDET